MPEFAEAKPTVGLALPATGTCSSFLRNSVPAALRKRLELRGLLYNTQERRLEPLDLSREL